MKVACLRNSRRRRVALNENPGDNLSDAFFAVLPFVELGHFFHLHFPSVLLSCLSLLQEMPDIPDKEQLVL